MGRDDQEVQREIKGKEGGMGIWQIWNDRINDRQSEPV